MKQISIIFLTLVFLCLASLAFAGNQADFWGTEIFGIKWESTKSYVTKSFPEGKSESKFGIDTYTIKDGRALFGIERHPQNYIKYTFDSNDKLIGVSIQFPMKSTQDYGSLLMKLNTIFGEGSPVPNSSGANLVRWPEDKGIEIGLLHVPGTFSLGDLVFTIEYKKAPEAITKKELGF